MPVLIYDPAMEQRIRTERDENPQANRYDEVWEGVLVVAPLPNNEHQEMVLDLGSVFRMVVGREGGHRVFAGVNVSDRDHDWQSNYREPDVAVYLATNSARDRGTHWVGGPDLAVEVVSPGEKPWDKLPFYASVKSREVLILDRNPWNLELYELKDGKMVLSGRSRPGFRSAVLVSEVLPITFQLKRTKPRPSLVITHTETKQVWTV